MEDWVSPLQRITAVHDAAKGLVQVYEDHSRGTARGAAAWSAYHYSRAGGVVLESWRDGARDVFILEVGKGELDLVPSVSAAGIEAAEVVGDEIHVTYAGLGGAGVGVTLCRKQAEGVLSAEVVEAGGGDRLGRAVLKLPRMLKLCVGIDDTDRAGQGATWSMANELGCKLGLMDGVSYLDHTLVQLFPGAPGKTTNCVGTVLTFGVMEDQFRAFGAALIGNLNQRTLSDQTSIAILEGIGIPPTLKQFSDTARARVVTVEDALAAAKACDVDVIEVTGKQGAIGAVASLGYAERHEEAVRLPG